MIKMNDKKGTASLFFTEGRDLTHKDCTFPAHPLFATTDDNFHHHHPSIMRRERKLEGKKEDSESNQRVVGTSSHSILSIYRRS